MPWSGRRAGCSTAMPRLTVRPCTGPVISGLACTRGLRCYCHRESDSARFLCRSTGANSRARDCAHGAKAPRPSSVGIRPVGLARDASSITASGGSGQSRELSVRRLSNARSRLGPPGLRRFNSYPRGSTCGHLDVRAFGKRSRSRWLPARKSPGAKDRARVLERCRTAGGDRGDHDRCPRNARHRSMDGSYDALLPRAAEWAVGGRPDRSLNYGPTPDETQPSQLPRHARGLAFGACRCCRTPLHSVPLADFVSERHSLRTAPDLLALGCRLARHRSRARNRCDEPLVARSRSRGLTLKLTR
jgi:hypothetical protein